MAFIEKGTLVRDKQSIIPERTNGEDTDITRTVPGYTDFDPVLNDYEPTHKDSFSQEASLGDCLDEITSKDLSVYLTTVNIEAKHSPILPIPRSSRSLYYNLLHILRTRKPGATLAALIDYHLLFPEHQSTKSYNLLIFLSIHHRAYGITHTLLNAMQQHSIQNNVETYRLHLRWFIYQGFWDRAWSYVMRLKNKFHEGSIPFPIWLEFCHSRKGQMIVLQDPSNPKKKVVQKLSEPSHLFSLRRKIMNANRPLVFPSLKDTRPVAIRDIVQLMLKTKMRHQALKLTEDYFKILPLELSTRRNHQCLSIVKVNLIFHATGKTGLRRFNALKKLLFSLLSLNPSLRLTSDTLLFVLSTLKKAKHCGTRAWNFVSLCKEKWGPEVEDRRVQRCVSKWALKEGRMDIAATILRTESLEGRSRRRRLLELEVVGDLLRPRAKFLRRPSVRRIYPRHGREAVLWYRLRRRFHRKLVKHLAQGRRLIKEARKLN